MNNLTIETVTIHQSAHAKLEWIENGGIVVKTFTGFIYDAELRDAFNAGLKKLQEEKGYKWLSDNRALKVYKKTDVDWINEVWLPQMISAGWKYWAILEPEGLFGQASMTHFIGFFQEHGIELKIYHEMEDAIAWLQKF